MSKVVIITGASSGIGLSTAQLLQDKGFIVYNFSRREAANEQFKSISVDVTNENNIIEALNEVYKREKRVDIVINNAGFGISGSAEDSNPVDVNRLFDVNFNGVFLMCKHVIPLMRKKGSGKIINISSMAAEFPIPFQSFYSASKSAISSFTYSLANEVNPFGIKVSLVIPGDIKTSFTSNRKKNSSNNSAYKDRIFKSINTMELDEKNGMDAKIIANLIYKIINSKNPPLQKTAGLKYKLFLILKRIVPRKFLNYILRKIYG